MSIYMVEKKDTGPKKKKRRKTKQKPKAGQVITQKVVVNVGKSVPKRKRTTGTQARRSVQPEIRYQPAGIPLQPNYSTQINDLTRKIEEPTKNLKDLENRLILYTGQKSRPSDEPRDETPEATGFQPQNGFGSGAEEPKVTQKPKITELPKTPAEAAAGQKRKPGRPSNAEIAARQAAADEAQRRMEEFAEEEGTNL